MDTVAANLDHVRERIAQACSSAGRSPDSVRLMGVSKRHPWERIVAAYDAGLRLFGENRVQEARAKWARSLPGAELHLVGQLQSNKVKDAVGLFTTVQSVDRAKIARALQKRAEDAAISAVDIFLEVNTSGEATKSGVEGVDALRELVDVVMTLDRVAIKGLMTIGPLTPDETQIRTAFARLRSIREALQTEYDWEDPIVLSMGMSDDLEYAVAEGSDMVRIGTAIFGTREPV